MTAQEIADRWSHDPAKGTGPERWAKCLALCARMKVAPAAVIVCLPIADQQAILQSTETNT